MLHPTIRRKRAPNIWEDMFNVRNEFDRLLRRRDDAEVTSAWCPVVDVSDSQDAVVLQAELPGVAPEQVDVSVENSVLTISGEKKHVHEEGKDGSEYHLVERRYGRFERSFSLPRTVDSEKVDATVTNGVLTVTLPKVEAAKPRKIAVKVSAN
jgi:HSP20 family protein